MLVLKKKAYAKKWKQEEILKIEKEVKLLEM
jgi:hypothetical protein